MSETKEAKLVGPVLNDREMFEAVIDAAEIDNPDVELTVADHDGYFRVSAPNRLRLTRESLEEALGKPFEFSEFEQHLASFSGHVKDLGDDEMIFYLDGRED